MVSLGIPKAKVQHASIRTYAATARRRVRHHCSASPAGPGDRCRVGSAVTRAGYGTAHAQSPPFRGGLASLLQRIGRAARLFPMEAVLR